MIDDINFICLNSPMCYNWRPCFAWVPVRTISGKKIWLKKIYKRKVRIVYKLSWKNNPVVDATQYGTTIDLLYNKYQHLEKYIGDK